METIWDQSVVMKEIDVNPINSRIHVLRGKKSCKFGNRQHTNGSLACDTWGTSLISKTKDDDPRTDPSQPHDHIREINDTLGHTYHLSSPELVLLPNDETKKKSQVVNAKKCYDQPIRTLRSQTTNTYNP